MNSSNRKIKCSVEILTRNSGAYLERCLDSIKDFDEVIILDGNSTDNTLDIAKKYGCEIYKQYDTEESLVRIRDFAEVRNRGLELSKNDWFMFIDSDEYLSSEAVDEIRTIVSQSGSNPQVWWQPRKYVLDGKIIECATTYPNKQIRLFNKNYVKRFIKPIHERIEIKEGAAVSALKNFEYIPLEDLGTLKNKWSNYLVAEDAVYASASRHKLTKLILRQTGILLKYCYRYTHNLFFCRGRHMPFKYEFHRHWFTVRLLKRIVLKLIQSFL